MPNPKKLLGLGQRAAEAMLKSSRTPRDEAIIEASKAAKQGFMEPSKERRRMYHATTEDFSEFSPNRRGAHFVTPSPEFANEFLGIIDEASEVPQGANIMPVYVQARNPFDYENPEHVQAVLSKAQFPKSVDQQAVRDNVELGSFGFIEDQNVQKAIRDLGFDSFYVKERGVKNLAVLEPTQIKSAIGMGGRYDIEDPDITKAGGGIAKIGKAAFQAAKGAKKAEKPIQEVKTFKTPDGYTFYRLPDGKVVDNLDPEKVDMSWKSEKQFLKDMEGAVYQKGDELGQRRATMESYGVPTQEKLLERISAFGEDDTSKFYAARKKQLEDAERRANISAVPSAPAMSPKEFQQFAEKGMIRFAKDKEQELRDLMEGRSKFAELYLNWDDPATYELIDPLTAQGFQTTLTRRGPSSVTYLYRDPRDVEPILKAENPAQYGKAYGYSDNDIARFYWERGLGLDQYLKDMATIPKPEEGKASGGLVMPPEVLGGGTGLPMAAGGDPYQEQQQYQAKKSADVQAYKQGKMGANELLDYFPGLTATMIEAQLMQAAGGPIEVKKKAGGEIKMNPGGEVPTIKELMMGKKLEVPEMKPIEQTPLEKTLGWVGQKAEAAGKAIGEATEGLKEKHPVKTFLSEFLVSDPLKSAGTALQDWTGTPREVPPKFSPTGEEIKGYQPTPGPFYGGSKATLDPSTWGPALGTFKFDPRALDVLGFGQVGASAAGKAIRGLSKMTKGAVEGAPKALPVGLSTEPVGTPIEQVITPKVEAPKVEAPKVEEVKAPANNMGLYSGLEKAALNLERKQGNGDAFLNDLRKLATKYGVSKEEFEFSGMEDFLKGKKNVSRDDIQDFAQKNRYDLTEVEYREGKGSTDEMEFHGDAIEDSEYIYQRAEDIKEEFDDYFPGRREKIIDEIESNYSADELADPSIRADIDNKIDEKLRDESIRRAHDEYWDSPYYEYENDLGYRVTGNDDSGWSVRDQNGNQVGDWFRNQESAEGAANQDAIERGLVSENQTQYDSYQLPLGENYREILIQNRVSGAPRLTEAQLRRYQELKAEKERPRSLDELSQPGGSRALPPDEFKEFEALENQLKASNESDEFSSSHWNEPDVIVHVRVQDRLTADQKPMLYVDELQSDWHQEGLKGGYKDKDFQKKYKEVYEEYLQKADAKREADREYGYQKREAELKLDNEFIIRMQRTPTRNEARAIEQEVQADPKIQELKKIFKEKSDEFEKIRKTYEKLTNAVPNAPFKENWHELGIKRMLNYAAKNGYDRIGFSSASPQIKRWGTQEFAWEKVPPYKKTKEDFAEWMKSKIREDIPVDELSDRLYKVLDSAWGDPLNSTYKEFLNELERPQGWKIVATEQRGGMAGRVDLEAEARARGLLKENPGERIDDKDGLRMIIKNNTRGMSEEQIDRLTDKTWARMQKFDTGISAPREEGMRAFYDDKMKNTLKKYAEKIGAKFYESSTRVGRGVSEGGGYADINEPVYVIEFTDKAKKSALKGQAYKEGGLVQADQHMSVGGVPKAAKAISDVIKGAVDNVVAKFASDAEKAKAKPIASEKVITNTVSKAAERIAKQNPKLSEAEVAKKAEREAISKLKWEREEKQAIEKRYGELEPAAFDEPRAKRLQNVPEVVEQRIQKAEEFLGRPTDIWQPPRPELQAFDRSLIKEAMEGFPGVEQTRFPRAQATRADLGYLEEIYGDPRNRSLIEKQIKRGLPLGGETFYASLYPVKVAAMERGIPEARFNQWVYENAPASARNSIFNEMAVGQFLRDMNARGLPLDEKTVTEEMAKFKREYGIGLPLMPVHREGVKAVIEGGQDLRELLKADIPTNYKIPTYGTQKAGDFGKSMVLDVHESAGQTLGSKYHPYFTEQGGFAPLEYGPAESQMLGIAEEIGIPGGMAQAGRWFGGGELTGLKSPRGDALDLLERQTAYTLQGMGIKPTPKAIRNYILDMIETGEGKLMPYFKSEPMPDVRTKKDGGLIKGGLSNTRQRRKAGALSMTLS